MIRDLVLPPDPPIPPVCPEQQRRFQMLVEKGRFKARPVRFMKRPPPLSPDEYRQLLASYRQPGYIHTPVTFVPGTVVSLSAHTCATRGEHDIYYDLANAPEDSGVFMILDPATGIADDEFKQSMIKRYRVTATSGTADEVLS